jgi:hypothetical protein
MVEPVPSHERNKERATQPQDPGLRWTVHLAKTHPTKAVVVVLFGIGAATFGVLVFQNYVLAALAIFMILWSTADFMLPVRYTIDSEGASCRYGLHFGSIHWDEVKRVTLLSDGVKLSPLERVSRLEPFRGVLLRYANNREEVLAAIERYGGPNFGSLEG